MDLRRRVDRQERPFFKADNDAREDAAGQVVDDDYGPMERAARAEEAEAVRASVAELPDRERAVFEGPYYRGLTLREVGGELGVIRQRAQELEVKALKRLGAVLEAAGG